MRTVSRDFGNGLFGFLKNIISGKIQRGIIMHTKTMEGLAGASMSMKLMNTPLRVYKEAERRGDTAVMEQAMGYASDFADKAEDYQKTTEKGMKEDAKEAREKAKAEQENAIQKRREQREELEKRIEEKRKGDTDAISISESEKATLDGKTDSVQTGANNDIFVEETADAIKMEPVIYTKTGEASKSESGMNLSVLV